MRANVVPFIDLVEAGEKKNKTQNWQIDIIAGRQDNHVWLLKIAFS